jgi:ACS family tartrate transporter-like MFS transporter
VIVLAALAVGLAANFAAFGAFFSLPAFFLRGTAAAGGLGLFCALGNIGGFFGPTLTGMLVQGSGNYRTGFAADAVGYALAALIVVAVGRALAPHKSKLLDTAVGI